MGVADDGVDEVTRGGPQVARSSRWPLPPLVCGVAAVVGLLSDAWRVPAFVIAGTVPVFGLVLSARAWIVEGRVARNRARTGWLLVGAGGAVLGGASIVAVTVAGDPASSAPALEDLPVAAGWMLGVAGVLSLIGGRARGRAVDSAIEALLVTAPIVYLSAAYVLDGPPLAVSRGTALLVILAVAADVIFVVLAAELVRTQQHHRRPISAALVLTGALAVLGVHAARAGVLLSDAVHVGDSDVLVVCGAILPAALWITAALHPAAHDHLDRVETVPTPLTRVRVIVVLLSVVVGPLVISLRLSSGRTDGAAGLTAGAVVVAAVAVSYLIRLVEQRARVEYLALHDDLCGIPNRVLLGDRIDAALAQSTRHGHRVALLFLDLDRFKTINDSLGHAAGNDLLRLSARRLGECVRGSDSVARLGGDEFAVLLPEVTDPTAPARVAASVLESFTSPFDVAGRQLFVSPSIGVSIYPDDAAGAEDLFRNADAAMYRAKENGRNTFEMFTREMNTAAHQRLTLESSLHKAIDRGELEMHYQPKVDLRTGEVIGMEALMRWAHPRLGMIFPNDFIPLAEETGLILPLGEWALEQSCAQTKLWRDAGHDRLTVAVNLSARQFQHQQVGDMVARVLRATSLDPAALELELTESLALQNPEAITATLRELKDMGVRCSIDDFGTGYSGLRYLTRFPIDKLKIDRFFISEIANGADNARIVAAVIALAHGLRLEVIAEGVESEDQLRFLYENDCDEMQGFLISEAVPADAFEQLLVPSTAVVELLQRAPHLQLVGADGDFESVFDRPQPADSLLR